MFSRVDRGEPIWMGLRITWTSEKGIGYIYTTSEEVKLDESVFKEYLHEFEINHFLLKYFLTQK